MTQPITLDFYTDFVWPWCYLSTGRIEKLKQNYNIKINTIYFPLHPETPDEGRRLDDLFGPDTDISGIMRHLKMLMDAEGLPFGEGRYMTFNSRLAQELAKWAEEKPERLVRSAEQVGLPVDEARDVLEQRAMQAAVDADWRYALSVGVSAVPTFAVGLKGMAGARSYEQLAQFLEHVGASKR